jgi:hypothetical protein
MKIETAEIVKILPTKIWYEKDFVGTVHVYMQHEGLEKFEFITIAYDWRYTSNGHQYQLTQEILKLLGANNDEGKSE